MKKKLYFPLSFIFIILVIWAILSYNRKDICSEFLKSLISPETYERALYGTDLAQFDQDCKSIFGRHLSEDGLSSLLAARLPYRYKTFIEINKVDKVKNIKLNRLKHSNEGNYTYSYYELVYTYESKDREIRMKDCFAIYLINEDGKNKISKVACISTKSSIYRLSVEVLKD